MAATDAAAVLAGLFYAAYLSSLPPEAIVGELEFVPAEAAYAFAGLAQLAALLVAALCFIRWFHLAHVNLGELYDAAPTYGSGWTIWGFFVPFLNLIRPQQVMREIWNRTLLRWEQEPGRVAGLTRPADRVNLWWGLFLATSFLSNAVGRVTFDAATAGETLHAAWLTILADAFDIGAVAVALLLVRSVTALQRPLLGHAPAGPVG